MRQNPHVRICGGPGSATTLVYPTPNLPNHLLRRSCLHHGNPPPLAGKCLLTHGLTWSTLV